MVKVKGFGKVATTADLSIENVIVIKPIGHN
jgi:hypothetical protein